MISLIGRLFPWRSVLKWRQFRYLIFSSSSDSARKCMKFSVLAWGILTDLIVFKFRQKEVNAQITKKWHHIRTSEITKYSFRLGNRPESSVKSSECRALLKTIWNPCQLSEGGQGIRDVTEPDEIDDSDGAISIVWLKWPTTVVGNPVCVLFAWSGRGVFYAHLSFSVENEDWWKSYLELNLNSRIKYFMN